jgi:pimeloyl-ACP methyl ester carboxylesterase
LKSGGGKLVTFVLVHGSWHGGWCWKEVAPLLQSSGHQVYAPTLSGLGARSHLADCVLDLATHITEIANLITYEDLSEVILVGHSYSGMVITGVANQIPERLLKLVYLDAYVPYEGESELDLWPEEEQAQARLDLEEGRRFRDPPPPEILGIEDTEMADWVSARLTPHPLSTYVDPPLPGNELSSGLPRIYVHCSEGPVASRTFEFAGRARELGWDMHELATGHDAMLTEPVMLADLFNKLSHAN